jgi:hypothetical protein
MSLPTSLDIGVASTYEFSVALSLLMEMQSLLGLAVTHAELDQKSGNEVLQIGSQASSAYSDKRTEQRDCQGDFQSSP